jgi:hypothetical protein
MWRNISLLLILAACNSENKLLGGQAPPVKPTPPPPSTPEQQDAYRQNFKPAVDVLWVVDNSSSMSDEQNAITTNFPVFMEFFLGSNLDYHIGVVSTDMEDENQSGKLVEKQGYRWIDPDTNDPSTVFAGMANLGTTGSGNEQGILGAYAALELQTEWNDGFFRDDSSIHIVTVSDEPDSSPERPVTKDEFAEYLNGLRPEDEMVTYNLIVNPRPSEPDHCAGLLSAVRYHDVHDAVGGIEWSVCSNNWVGVLEALGLQTAGLKREYFLSDLPVADTVVVTVVDLEGTEFEFDEVDPSTGEGDWSYNASRNSVTFLTYVPDEGSTVYIDYLLLSSLEEAQD